MKQLLYCMSKEPCLYSISNSATRFIKSNASWAYSIQSIKIEKTKKKKHYIHYNQGRIQGLTVSHLFEKVVKYHNSAF